LRREGRRWRQVQEACQLRVVCWHSIADVVRENRMEKRQVTKPHRKLQVLPVYISERRAIERERKPPE